MKRNPLRQFFCPMYPLIRRRMFLVACFVALVFASVGILAATSASGPVTLFSPARVGGATGNNDERDIDTYPVIAYDPATGRYLVVWMSPQNAGSSSDGLDVYGVFLNRTGQPMGSEFRISDSNTAARNGVPAIATGNGEFAVAWTARSGYCRIHVQRITDSSARSDRVLVSGTAHRHSPNLIYNVARQRYVLAFVDGDDYLPPTFYGAQTTDCGNNASSARGVKAIEFYFSGDVPVASSSINVSDVSSGGFRPRLGYSAALNQYLVAWEDRRNAGGQAYRFDVYARRVNTNLTVTENNIALATGSDYTNYDTTATWTPRPAVAGGVNEFLVTWFNRTTQAGAVTWSVMGRLVPTSGTPGTAFTIAGMTFAQQHTGNSPAGFLGEIYNNSAQEYMVGMTSYQESLWGYLSSALIQRVSVTGQLLDLNGAIMSQPGVGYSVDYTNEDQISLGMAVNPIAGPKLTENIIVYSKHTPSKPAQDSDIWDVRIQLPAPNLKSVYLPVVFRR